MTINRNILGITLAMLLVGCAGIRDSRLRSSRESLMTIYQDQTRPMTERMAAFDDLLDTFTSGTREATLDRFVGALAITRSRISGYIGDDGVYVRGNTFSYHLVAPDGSDRWITMTGDRVQ